MLYVEAYWNKDRLPDTAIIIDTTSKSRNWTKGLSPFILEAGHLYGNFYAKNVENAWQASKVYECHDNNGMPTKDYFLWAQKIWNDTYAHRYPMGKGVKPLYSWWDGKKLTYIEARKKIYIPIYARSVIKTKAFKQLLYICRTAPKDVYLIDFDGYNHIELGMSLTEVLNNPDKKMGHSFVLYSLIEKIKNEQNS